MSEYTERLGTIARFLKGLESACSDQGVEYLDGMIRFMTQFGIGKSPEADRLFKELAAVIANNSFYVVYSNLRVHLGLTLRVVAPLQGLKMTVAQAARLAEVQYWQLLPDDLSRYEGAHELLRRELFPYRIVSLQPLKGEDCKGKYHTWRPGQNLGGLVDANENFGPQDVIVLVD